MATINFGFMPAKEPAFLEFRIPVLTLEITLLRRSFAGQLSKLT